MNEILYCHQLMGLDLRGNLIKRSKVIAQILIEREFNVPSQFIREFVNELVIDELIGDSCMLSSFMDLQLNPSLYEDQNWVEKLNRFILFYHQAYSILREESIDILHSKKYIRNIPTIVAISLFSTERQWKIHLKSEKKLSILSNKGDTYDFYINFIFNFLEAWTKSNHYYNPSVLPKYLLNLMINKVAHDIPVMEYHLLSKDHSDLLLKSLDYYEMKSELLRYSYFTWLHSTSAYFPSEFALLDVLSLPSSWVSTYMKSVYSSPNFKIHRNYIIWKYLPTSIKYAGSSKRIPSSSHIVSMSKEGSQSTDDLCRITDTLLEYCESGKFLVEDLDVLCEIRPDSLLEVRSVFRSNDSFRDRLEALVSGSDDFSVYTRITGITTPSTNFQMDFIKNGGNPLDIVKAGIHYPYSILGTPSGIRQVLRYCDDLESIGKLWDKCDDFRNWLQGYASCGSLCDELSYNDILILLKALVKTYHTVYLLELHLIITSYVSKIGLDRLIAEFPEIMGYVMRDPSFRSNYSELMSHINQDTLQYIPIQLLSEQGLFPWISSSNIFINTDSVTLDYVISKRSMDDLILTKRRIFYMPNLSSIEADAYIEQLATVMD